MVLWHCNIQAKITQCNVPLVHLMYFVNDYCTCSGEELKAKAPPETRFGKFIIYLRGKIRKLKGITATSSTGTKFTKWKTKKKMARGSLRIKRILYVTLG